MRNLCIEFLTNKAEIERITARNKEITAELEKAATFKDGSSTGHIPIDGFKVTLTRRINTSWDQKGLETVRQLAGDKEFSLAFTYEFKPRSKADLDVYLRMAPKEVQEAIAKAKTDKPGAMGIEIKAVES